MVRSSMSYWANRELLAHIAGRYQDATGTRKSHILNEFAADTGYDRNDAARLPSEPVPPVQHISWPRSLHYSTEMKEAFSIARAAVNCVCPKSSSLFYLSLIPFKLDTLLERRKHLELIQFKGVPELGGSGTYLLIGNRAEIA